MLAARAPQLLAMDAIVATLWGDAPPAKAEANVASLVSRLRSVLGAEVIDGTRRGYRLAIGASVTVDLVEAGHLVNEGEHRLAAGQPALALTAAHGGLAVLVSSDGAVLAEDDGEEWAAETIRSAARLVRRGEPWSGRRRSPSASPALRWRRRPTPWRPTPSTRRRTGR